MTVLTALGLGGGVISLATLAGHAAMLAHARKLVRRSAGHAITARNAEDRTRAMLTQEAREQLRRANPGGPR